VVVVTAGGFRPEQAVGLGLVKVLRKPVHAADLLEAIRQSQRPDEIDGAK
jgi:hypothetical protein